MSEFNFGNTYTPPQDKLVAKLEKQAVTKLDRIKVALMKRWWSTVEIDTFFGKGSTREIRRLRKMGFFVRKEKVKDPLSKVTNNYRYRI